MQVSWLGSSYFEKALEASSKSPGRLTDRLAVNLELTVRERDGMLGLLRMYLALEGAIRTNIGELLSQLMDLKIEGFALTQ